MDIRYSVNQRDFKRYTTEEIRREFLIENLYVPDEVVAVYSHVDRMVTLGCMPVVEAVPIDKGISVWETFGTKSFLERREIGVFNIGAPGRITVDGTVYKMGKGDCLYIAMGAGEVLFQSDDGKLPAKFYMVSAPAHKAYQTTFISLADAAKRPLGAVESANKRVINQFIHPDVLQTCQLCMGMTVLEPGSVWNTMPCHTHERRMEIYTYFDLPADNVVVHLMGESSELRPVIVSEGQAVISPSWSVHAGCGTASYTFIWAMGGENMEFDDMDMISTTELR